jgi:hypothetical protein
MSPRRAATQQETEEVAEELANEAAGESRVAAKAKVRAKALAQAVLNQVEPEPESGPEFEDAGAAIIAPEPSKMDRILSQLQNEGKFEVFRQIGGASSKVGIFSISEWPDRLETIAAQYGGGTFKVIFKDARGVIRGQDTQTFDPEAYANKGGAKSTPSASGDGSVVERLMERMEAREERHAREMAELRMEMVKQQNQLIQTLASREPAPQSNLLDTIKLVKEMMPPPPDPMEGLTRTLEIMAQFKEKAEEVEPKSPLVVAIEEGMKMLSPLLAVVAQKVATPSKPARVGLETRVPAPLVTAPTPALPPAGGAALTAPPATQPSLLNPPVPEVVIPEAVTAYAPRLLLAAQSGSKPSTIGNFVVDSLPVDDQEIVDEFDEMLAHPQIVELFIAAEPQLARYRPWLTDLLNHMTDYWDSMEVEEPMTPEAAPAPDAAPAPASASGVVVMPAPAPAPAPVAEAPTPSEPKETLNA